MKEPVLFINSRTSFTRLKNFTLLSLLFGFCLMLARSSNGAVLPFNCASNGLGPDWTLVFNDGFTGTSLNKTNWAPYWFSDGTLNPGSNTRGYASNVTVNSQLNLLVWNSTSHPIGGNINTSPGTHIYGVNWYAGHLDFYYDGTRVASASNASLSGGATISSSPMYLILLYDYGGSGPVPATMVVHYVRVFQSTPPLSVVRTNGTVSLSWNASGFILQTNKDSRNPAGWGDVPNATNSPTTITDGSSHLFFRLRRE